MASDFYRTTRVLVTGHTGFKGTWLTLWLKELGAEVAGFSLPEEGKFFDAVEVGQEIESYSGDLGQLDALLGVFRKFQPELVFHLAAQSLVGRSYADPVWTYATNVMGTVNVLEAVRRTESVRGVVVVTSDKVYENREWDWPYREADRLGGHDPYSNSKACVEMVADSFRRSFLAPEGRVQLATVRAGNVIGGGDWAEARLVPDLARAAIAGESLQLRSPNSVRPWQYVLDPLDGYLKLGERLAQGDAEVAQAWNFGPPEDLRVTALELVTLFAEAWPAVHWEHGEGSFKEAHTLRVCSSRARARLDWAPRLSLETSVRSTAAWYRVAAERPQDLPGFTRRQLKAYLRGTP